MVVKKEEKTRVERQIVRNQVNVDDNFRGFQHEGFKLILFD